ncbi:unnamed protein product [Heligmosomoides polygyrus]|uniref:Uncharacterized protein n=1 Tax=Heligmosomoides polygyrus TaxID=6339 RepID=A0A183GLN5_HELPZ|nr:unnamed protein product [Heligmosomoides polygyrus]
MCSVTEPIAVRVFVRPLEISLPSDHLASDKACAPPLPEQAPPQPTVWSTMSSRIEAETSVKRWSTPVVKTEEGQPPGPVRCFTSRPYRGNFNFGQSK